MDIINVKFGNHSGNRPIDYTNTLNDNMILLDGRKSIDKVST